MIKKIINNNYQTFFSAIIFCLLITSTFMGLHILHEEGEMLENQETRINYEEEDAV
jgi:hypothetical protein